MIQRIGVCALQGDFEKHIEAIRNLEDPDVESFEVRTPEELATTHKLILPGGESTTVGKLMQRFGLGASIQSRAQAGMPIWGTCMGMILMVKEIEDRPDQWTLGLMDATIRRNAFGAQVHSFEAAIEFHGLPTPTSGVFIRAPIVTKISDEVEVLARYDDKIVAIRQGNLLGTSFHPELTDDRRIHRAFAAIPFTP